MFRTISFALAIGWLLASAAAAQEIRATLFGRVIDQSGSSVPGARIVISNRLRQVNRRIAELLDLYHRRGR